MIVVDSREQPLRVACDFCRSEHNFRGGPRNAPQSATTMRATENTRATEDTRATDDTRATEGTDGSGKLFRKPPAMSEPRIDTPSTSLRASDLEATIRRIIREETGLTPVAPAEKWRGGQLVLKPGKPGVQEKSWPIDSFFHKVVMLRNRLRTLEQQVNASELPDDQKLKIQSYITGCYGSLTSFNVLFADEDDRFVGAAGD